MQRTINHTGRRKLARSEVSIKLIENPGEAPSFDADFSLNTKNLSPDAAIYVEAYSGNTLQRFEYGTVGAVAQPADRTLKKIDLTAKTQFRVRIVDESSHIGRLVASLQDLKAEGDDDRASLMTLASRPLGQETWRVNILEADKPELVINSSIPNSMGQLKDNPLFQALILPAAFKQVLLFYVWDGQFEDETPQAQWLALGEHFAGEKPHTEDPSELNAWVDLVIERFSEKFELCEMIKLKLEEAA